MTSTQLKHPNTVPQTDGVHTPNGRIGGPRRRVALAGVLVGGSSARMGTPKALLPHPSGRTFIEHVVTVVQHVADHVALLGRTDPLPDSLKRVPVLPDRIGAQGPLSGLDSLLARADGGWTLLIACDMPLLDVATVNDLVRSIDDRYDAVAYASDASGRFLHACCAAYHARLAEAVGERLRTGRLSLQALLADVRTKRLNACTQRQTSLTNVNMPADLRRIT